MRKKLLPLNHAYSVSSGVFGGVDDAIRMKLNEYGRYEYAMNGKPDRKLLAKLNKIDMMSDYSDNEDTLGDSLFSRIKGIKHNKIIGYYTDLYAGHVKESTFRSLGTSGGFGTWLLCELLATKEIDGVIHPHAVDPKQNNGVLFKYQISRTEADIKKGSKARYYPMELSSVLQEVKVAPGRYAVVGISDFITELRLLCEQEPVFKERIVYMIGLFNAHQKTTKYAEALAWQQGIAPGDLESVDFRVKDPDSMAWDYKCNLVGLKDGKKVSITKPMTGFPIHYWNMGFFKSRFSDFTDNAFNELADITLGDAWLHEYAQNPKGTNILIIRNPTIAKLIKKAIADNRIALDKLSEEKIIASQGMVSHIIHELPYRLYKNGRRGHFVPQKRTVPSKDIPFMRRRIQDLRQKVVEKNDNVYQNAIAKQSFDQYARFVDKYNKINDRMYRLMKYRAKLRPRQVVRRLARAILLPIVHLKQKVRLRTRARKVAAIVYNRRVNGAILTLNDDFNYGNVMQRYALQHFLRNNQLVFVQLSMHTKYLQSIRDRYIQNGLAPFVNKNIRSRNFDTISSVGYKNYIVGSDQVWRNHGTDNIERDYLPYWLYFLGRVRSNLIAYAASFGVNALSKANIDSSLAERIRPLMSKFKAISVREDSGRQLVDEIAGREINAKTVLDPTLLLTKKDYSNLIDDSKSKSSKTPRVFSYILDLDDNKEEVIENIARQYNSVYRIVTADPSEKMIPVEEWLKGFRDAEFIATDSFHGAVFAIVNETNFIVLANEERGLARMDNLLQIAGISRDRLIFPNKEGRYTKYDNLKPIDWSSVHQRIADLRRDSGEWLKSNIKAKGL